jgi:hypothetical protein
MKRLNWGRIFAGGILAGVVSSLVYVPYYFAYRDDLARVVAARQLPNDWLRREFIYGVVAMPSIGILCVWLYVTIRSRFGPGARTAVVAAVVFWGITLLAEAAYQALGLWPWWLFAVNKVTDLAAITLGTLAGAYLYKEKQE